MCRNFVLSKKKVGYEIKEKSSISANQKKKRV